jgi:hypothetical protein
MTPDGRLQVFYYDETNGNLRHAWWNGSAWSYESLDGGPGAISTLNADLGTDPTTAVFNGILHVFYRDTTNGNLRHAWDHPTTGWRFENLEGSPSSVSQYDSDVGQMPTATVLGSTLQVYYYEPNGGNLRHAFSDATGWHFENLDGAGGNPSTRYNANVGWDPAAVAYQGHVQLIYYDVTNNNLRHAWSQ